MKKRGVRISVLCIVFYVMFLVASSGARAETHDGEKKDLVAALHLEAASLGVPKGDSLEKKDRPISNKPAILVPLKEGLHAFFDLASTPYKGLTPKDDRKNSRVVVGFHFPLK